MLLFDFRCAIMCSSAGDTATNQGRSKMEFSKAQWEAEMAEAKANGCVVMSFERWVAYRKEIAKLFEEVA